jgi:hypothetical protein
MERATDVLKCRECGAVHSLSYSQVEHRDRDHCDGSLERYCKTCKRFYDGHSCAECSRRLDEDVERMLRQRQAAIARWRAYPVIAQVDWLVRRHPSCRQAMEDWEHRAALRTVHRQFLTCASFAVLAGLAVPSAMKLPVFACMAVLAAYASTLKTLPTD